MFKDLKTIEIYKYFYLALLVFSMLFARPFVGLSIFGFRLGELLIGVCFLFSLALLTFYRFLPKKLAQIPLNNIFRIIILSVFIVVFLTNSSLLKPYFVRSSSYVWSIAFIYFGIFFLDILKKKYLLAGLSLVPLVVYFFSTGRYPDFIIRFFNTWSDKFQFIKGSDLMLTYIVVSLSLLMLLKNKYASISYLFIASAAFFPLLLFNSRGAFLAALIFFVFQIIFEFKFLMKNKLFLLALGF